MLDYLKDKWRAARLKARYQRIVQEQVLELIQRRESHAVSDDPGRWLLLGDQSSALSEQTRKDVRAAARRLAIENPHARNILRLLEIYVVGPGLRLSHQPRATSARENSEILKNSDKIWHEFLAANHRHFSYREYARRCWRDGECFLRLFPQTDAAPTVRFVDPERIGPTLDDPDSQGVLTEPGDVEQPRAYLHVDAETGELIEEIPAEELLHTRVGVDSNQKRGLSIFASTLEALGCFDRWLETELTARKLQASIVLWRKVQGSPSQAHGLAQSAATGSDPPYPGRPGGGLRERYQPGSILTTSAGTEMQFLQPNTNFGDAVPLGRLLLLTIAAGAGLPEFMLTSDASNANFASTMVAEGPAVKLFQSEQIFFAREFEGLWRWVMQQAIARDELPENFFEWVAAEWTYPDLVNRDRPREREADVKLVDSSVLSRAEIARREKVDPELMREEIATEQRNVGASTTNAAKS